MSLDTVLQIGKVLRSSGELKYLKYIEPCPQDKNGNWPICITIPVNEDYSFNWEKMVFTPENERPKLLYLKFKTSGSDGLVKYIYGDIFYSKKATLSKVGQIESSEDGYYRLANPNHSNAAYRPSSFNRGISDCNDIIVKNTSGSIAKFHQSLKQNNNIEMLERILKYAPVFQSILEDQTSNDIASYLNDEEKLYSLIVVQSCQKISSANLKKIGADSDFENLNEVTRKKLFDLMNYSIYIHFEFPNKKHWHEYSEDMNSMNEKVLGEFVDNTAHGLVLKKSLYKTLCSGDKKGDSQFPSFKSANRYQSKVFQNLDLQDLFYATEYTSKGKLISGTDIKLIILPRGDKLTSKDYDVFQEKRDESRVLMASLGIDPLFDFMSDKLTNIISFDLIFCKNGGVSSPDSDLIELSGIEKSQLKQTMERIRQISQTVNKERKEGIRTEKDLYPLSVEYSFRCLLGTPQSDMKTGKVTYRPTPKYQSHLLKVLPLIYSNNYYHDEVLLPAFIQNVEYSIRSGEPNYLFLKYDLKFLLLVQNINNSQINRFMEITSSKSYQIGMMLGDLAQNLRREINSFEKNYVGNLSRRISTLPDFIKLKNEIEQKLIMHDKVRYTSKKSYDLAQKIKDFKQRYDKEECAFGFMESYFKPLPAKTDVTPEIIGLSDNEQ